MTFEIYRMNGTSVIVILERMYGMVELMRQLQRIKKKERERRGVVVIVAEEEKKNNNIRNIFIRVLYEYMR